MGGCVCVYAAVWVGGRVGEWVGECEGGWVGECMGGCCVFVGRALAVNHYRRALVGGMVWCTPPCGLLASGGRATVTSMTCL